MNGDLPRATIQSLLFLGLALTSVGQDGGGLIVKERPQSENALQSVTVSGHAMRLRQAPFLEAQLERLRVPDGFTIRVFAKDLERPRMMTVSDSGTVYVAEQDAGRVLAFTPASSPEGVSQKRIVADGLEKPHGLAIHNGNLYIATVTELHRAPIAGDGSLGARETVFDDLPDGGQHPNRTIGVSPDGQIFLSVGSTCNNCSEPDKEHATMLRVDPAAPSRTVFAKGLRNTIGFGWHPQTGQFWGMDHGSDWRGNDTPPEELNLIQEGKDYGWPFCYGNREPDMANTSAAKGQTKEEYCKGTEAPALSYQAHSAPIAMVFYDREAFPPEYRNNAFVAMRGSWNRNPPVGYKVVRLVFDGDGKPQKFEDFATGWLMEDQSAEFGRLAGLAVSRQGSLLVIDDRNGVIYEISHNGEARGGQ